MEWGNVISLISIAATIILAYKTGTNSKEIEVLKSELKVEEIKRTEYQQRLFTIYAKIWETIQNTVNLFLVYTQPLQQYPDINKMTETELEEFLQDSEFSKSHQKRILESSNKYKEYTDLIFWYRLNKLKMLYNDLYFSFVINKIFFSKELNENLDSLIKVFNSALIDIETGGETKDLGIKDMGFKLIRNSYKKIDTEAQAIINRIEELIRTDIQ